MNKVIQKIFGRGNNISGDTVLGDICITSGSKVVINGVDVTSSCGKPGKYELVLRDPDGGDVISFETPCSIQLSVEGTCEDINTTNGDVFVSGDAQDVSTTNGDVDIGGSCKKARTTNGDITVKGSMKVSGASTVNGDITFK